AAALGEPAVVNLSYSSQRGAHDGSYALDKALSALTGPGKIIVTAAGNYGQVPVHARTSPSVAGQSVSLTFSVPTPSSSGQFDFVQIEGWHNDSASFDVQLTTPSGIRTQVISPAATSGYVSTTDGAVTLTDDQVANDRASHQIVVYLAATSGYFIRPGTWTLTVTRRSG